MKKIYEKPVIDCAMFELENILMLSGGARLAETALGEKLGEAARITGVDVLAELKLTI